MTDIQTYKSRRVVGSIPGPYWSHGKAAMDKTPCSNSIIYLQLSKEEFVV